MNQPIEYFSAKYQKEIAEYMQGEREAESRQKKEYEEAEFKKYQELKEKYEAKFIPIETEETETDPETRRIKNEILEESKKHQEENK